MTDPNGETTGGVFYEYRCSAGHTQLARFPMGEAAETVPCEHCDLTALRIFAMPGVSIADDRNFCWRYDQRRQTEQIRKLSKERQDELQGFGTTRAGTLGDH